jgi:oxidase EvaA
MAPDARSSSELAAWMEALRQAPDMRVDRIAFGQCAPWIVDGKTIARTDARFFALSCPEEGKILVEQPEVGLLAFVLVEGAGAPHVVIHAKDEPGNLFLTQLAPTVQATRSNFERVHGGRKTPMLENLFQCGRVLSDTMQSEHSAHFWRKRNRNAAVLLQPEYVHLDKRLRVFPMRELLSLCLTDHAVNTDARSVLATAPWSALTEDEPFSRSFDHFGRLLRESYAARAREEAAAEFLARHRGPLREESIFRKPLQLTPEAMAWGTADQAYFVAVRASTREVVAWNQPILAPAFEDRQVLVGRHGEAGLEFLLRIESSKALFCSAEFAPTLSGDKEFAKFGEIGQEIAVLRQTDEGGRFWRAVCRYEIRLLPEADRGDALAEAVRPACWVTLRQLETLAARELTTTNELRTLVSMLLYWL